MPNKYHGGLCTCTAIGPHVVGKLSSIFLKTRIPEPPSQFSQHDYNRLNLKRWFARGPAGGAASNIMNH